MVVDAAPHLLSTPQALLGPGQLQDIDTEFQHLPDLGAHAHGLITLDICNRRHVQAQLLSRDPETGGLCH